MLNAGPQLVAKVVQTVSIRTATPPPADLRDENPDSKKNLIFSKSLDG